MRDVSVLIKPVSGSCNLSCKYCFYRDEMKSRAVPLRGVMSGETAENLVRALFAAAEGSVSVVFQGGEPMLAGLAFFRRFVELVKRYNAAKLPVHYGLQTNGTLINAEWCAFFAEHRFLIGVSLDGTQEIHDSLRAGDGGGSYNRVLAGIRLLEKYRVEYNVLVVVTKYLARHYQKAYNELKRRGFRYLQFIACLDPLEGLPQDYSLTAEAYGDFLVGTYGLWRADAARGEAVSIRLFDNLTAMLRGGRAELCPLMGRCSMQNVVEADGTVYPCDFYCLDEYAAGNINEMGFEELYGSAAVQRFLAQAPPGECRVCRLFRLCGGGCRRERSGGKSVFCESYQRLLTHMLGEA